MKFSINEEKRVIVALIPDARKQALQDLKRIFQNKKSYDLYSDLFSHGQLIYFIRKHMPDVVRGKAKCSPEDTWNPIIGCNLAEIRARLRYYEYCETILIKYVEYLEKIIMDPIISAFDYVIHGKDAATWMRDSLLRKTEFNQFHGVRADKE